MQNYKEAESRYVRFPRKSAVYMAVVNLIVWAIVKPSSTHTHTHITNYHNILKVNEIFTQVHRMPLIIA